MNTPAERVNIEEAMVLSRQQLCAQQQTVIKSILRIFGALLFLATAALIAAWFYFNEEHTLLDTGMRAQFNETFIELPNGMVHYEFGGPIGGEMVVLVHGFSVPAYIWDPTFDSLTSAGYRVLRFDLYGRGHSDRPDVAYSITFFADQLNQLTRALSVDSPFNLLGLSMGGPITAQFTNQHPGKVKRLVLIDPMVFTPSEDDISLVSLPVIGEYIGNVYLVPQLAAGQTSDFQDKDRFPDWESRFREQMQYHGFRRAILSTVREWPNADILGEYEKLGKSGTPVQLFWGREDQTVPLKSSNKLLELVPQAKLTVIDNAGHIPHFELPAIFDPLLLEYLQAPLAP
jgi:pimeloyl-ACP methyl ester carboxylesterase